MVGWFFNGCATKILKDNEPSEPKEPIEPIEPEEGVIRVKP